MTYIVSDGTLTLLAHSLTEPMCNNFHARQANSDKITFYGVLFSSFVMLGSPLLSGMKFCLKILETLSYHTVKIQGLYLT